MSGPLRREMLSFHWFSNMGLARKVLPDDDELLQAALLLDSGHREICGVNKSFWYVNERWKKLTACSDFGESWETPR